MRLCSHGFCLCFFFFQAEDGIRDGHVTGVQTCALPIYPATHRRPHPPCPGPATGGVDRSLPRRLAEHHRSEERRVGKECRSQWAREHYKETTKTTEDEHDRQRVQIRGPELGQRVREHRR